MLCGGRFSHLLAQYLGLHLMQLRDDVRFLPDREVERASLLAGTRRRDDMVVFDYRRYETDKVALAERVASRGGAVVLFTDPWLSPVSAGADTGHSGDGGHRTPRRTRRYRPPHHAVPRGPQLSCTCTEPRTRRHRADT
ncbi:MurR/RpiR family transcriptional regulator [Actinokineospora guangxiensis]|uniref:MurR/RpiR family transcriptional regulator n=1 Tax=Actinokineospora guangxiensis TaxID=1490288 RepID=A0ABW0EW51_9PSEU